MNNPVGVRYEYQEKHCKTYNTAFVNVNESQVYTELANELIAKKLNECLWIRSIKRKQLYNGFIEIVITYDHGGRRVYTVRSH